MSAAHALTTNRRMFPKDLIQEPQDGSRIDRASITRKRDHLG